MPISATQLKKSAIDGCSHLCNNCSMVSPSVTVILGSDIELEAIEDWLRDHAPELSEMQVVDVSYENGEPDWVITLDFAREEDAMLFKMTWIER